MKRELSKPLIAQQGFYFGASVQVQPDWSHVWLEMQFEGEEWATFSLFVNEGYQPLDPFRLSWKLEGIAVLKLFQFLI